MSFRLNLVFSVILLMFMNCISETQDKNVQRKKSMQKQKFIKCKTYEYC